MLLLGAQDSDCQICIGTARLGDTIYILYAYIYIISDILYITI